MKIIKLCLLFSFTLVSSCNFYSWMDSSSNDYEACKDAADSGNVNKAIEICETLLASTSENSELYASLNTELGDLYLRRAGMSLTYLADIFLDDACQNNAIDCYLSFAEGLLRRATVSSVTRDDVTKAAEYFNDLYDYYVAKGDDERKEAAEFLINLSKISKFSYLLAYTDVDGNSSQSEGDNLITLLDICGGSDCGEITGDSFSEICMGNTGDTCDGMIQADAITIYNSIDELSSALGSEFEEVQEAINEFKQTIIPDPVCVNGTDPVTEGCVADEPTATACLYCFLNGSNAITPVIGQKCGDLSSGEYIDTNCDTLLYTVEDYIQNNPSAKADVAREMVRLLVNQRTN